MNIVSRFGTIMLKEVGRMWEQKEFGKGDMDAKKNGSRKVIMKIVIEKLLFL